jgi:hypothetical protein
LLLADQPNSKLIMNKQIVGELIRALGIFEWPVQLLWQGDDRLVGRIRLLKASREVNRPDAVAYNDI